MALALGGGGVYATVFPKQAAVWLMVTAKLDLSGEVVC